MSQSQIWDALQLVGDALQDGRLDDAEGVLVEVDAMGAWDFELKSRRIVSLAALDALVRRVNAISGYTFADMRLISDPNCPPGRAYVVGGDVSINPHTLAALELGKPS